MLPMVLPDPPSGRIWRCWYQHKVPSILDLNMANRHIEGRHNSGRLL